MVRDRLLCLVTARLDLTAFDLVCLGIGHSDLVRRQKMLGVMRWEDMPECGVEDLVRLTFHLLFCHGLKSTWCIALLQVRKQDVDRDIMCPTHTTKQEMRDIPKHLPARAESFVTLITHIDEGVHLKVHVRLDVLLGLRRRLV